MKSRSREELEYQAQIEAEQAQLETSEPVRKEPEHTEPYRKGAEGSDPVRNSAETSGHSEYRPNHSPDRDSRIIELESQVRSLEVDRAVRDRHIEFLSKEIEQGKRTLASQSQFIGHLKTTVYQLGGTPDEQRYLKPPLPEDVSDDAELVTPDIIEPHPKQGDLYTG